MMNFSGARAHKFAESPVLKLRGDYLAIVTLGFGVCRRGVRA